MQRSQRITLAVIIIVTLIIIYVGFNRYVGSYILMAYNVIIIMIIIFSGSDHFLCLHLLSFIV